MIERTKSVDWAKKNLKKNKVKGIDYTIKLLLEKAINTSEVDLPSLFYLTEKQDKKFKKLVEMCCNGQSLESIVGYTYFFNLKILYDKNIYTPDQHSQLLAELLTEEVEARTKMMKKDKNILSINVLDMCCGSGCLGLSIMFGTKATVTFSDISRRAIVFAKKNYKLNKKLNKEIVQSFAPPKFIVGDMFKRIKSKFDIIVCNPPHARKTEVDKQAKEFGKPKSSIYGGEDGFDYYKELSVLSPLYLHKDGMIFLEIESNKKASVMRLLKESFYDIKTYDDNCGKVRFVTARLKC